MLHCYGNGGEDGLYPRCSYKSKGEYIFDDIQVSRAAMKYTVAHFTSEDDFGDNYDINKLKNTFGIDTNEFKKTFEIDGNSYFNNMSEVD